MKMHSTTVNNNNYSEILKIIIITGQSPGDTLHVASLSALNALQKNKYYYITR